MCKNIPVQICQDQQWFIAGRVAKVLVHNISLYIHLPCFSAGIGRTGVFIGADIGMQQLDNEGEVDVLRILSSLRQDRGGMIQTKEQYVFLHQVTAI